jgi:hypothetical protein
MESSRQKPKPRFFEIIFAPELDALHPGSFSRTDGDRRSSPPRRLAALLDIDPYSSVPNDKSRLTDAQPHVLTALHVVDVSNVHVVRPADIPNFNWLRPGLPNTEQQAFGDALLAKYQLAVLPSAVSTHSWNLIFDPTKSKGAYRQSIQEPFALDPRLHPPT